LLFKCFVSQSGLLIFVDQIKIPLIEKIKDLLIIVYQQLAVQLCQYIYKLGIDWVCGVPSSGKYLPLYSWIFKYSTGGKVIKLRVCSPTDKTTNNEMYSLKKKMKLLSKHTINIPIPF
jgi:hypothetical protein